MDTTKPAGCFPWDAYKVWKILLHRHPVRVEDPSGSCGHIDRGTLAEFCEAISDYPDFLQDALLVIAHADGLEAAADALDRAVREYLASQTGRLPVGYARAPEEQQAG
jgi:hypothetical protein